MIEFPNNEFSENMDFDEAMTKFKDFVDNDVPVKALHVGTIAELNRVRFEGGLEHRIEALEKKFKSLEPAPKSSTIIIPTDEEIAMFVNADSPCSISVI